MPVFRPAPFLAVGAMLLPITAAIITSFVLLDHNQHVPFWLPVAILLCIPPLTVGWLFMRSVRLSPMGIAVGRSFRRWHEIAWRDILHVERHGLYIQIHSSRGDSIRFAPRLLLDGSELLAILFNYLAPQVLDGSLRREALDHMPIPEADLTGMLRARPRNRWPMSGFTLSLLGIAGAAAAVQYLEKPLGWVLCFLGIMVALLGVAIAVWLLQEVIVTPEGLTIIRPLQRSPDEIVWNQVRVVDYSTNWTVVGFRIGHSVRCIGPAMLRRPERDRMYAFIDRYCLQHGALGIQHRFLF